MTAEAAVGTIGPEEVEACRAKLQSLKAELQQIQSSYSHKARVRMQNQKMLASITQRVQHRFQNPHTDDDLDLVEDSIVIVLAAETAAKVAHDEGLVENLEAAYNLALQNAPPNPQPGQRTKNAAEAFRLYQGQTAVLEANVAYRKALNEVEGVMADCYRKGIDDMVVLMHDESIDLEFAEEIESMASGSSEKKKKAKK